MKRWKPGLRFLPGVVVFLALPTISSGQSLKSKFQLESSAGIFSYDEHLAFNASPSFGAGAGYRLQSWLQLNVHFSFIPTQQNISQATSEFAARYTVFNSSLDLRCSLSKLILKQLRPFFLAGFGMLTFNPHPVRLQLGAGDEVVVEAPAEHFATAHAGFGIVVTVVRSSGFLLEYRRILHHMQDPDGLPGESILAQESQARLGLVFGL